MRHSAWGVAALTAAALLLVMTAAAFGLHHHADGQAHPENCPRCVTAALSVLTPPDVLAPDVPAAAHAPASSHTAGPTSRHIALPPGRAPPLSFV